MCGYICVSFTECGHDLQFKIAPCQDYQLAHADDLLDPTFLIPTQQELSNLRSQLETTEASVHLDAPPNGESPKVVHENGSGNDSLMQKQNELVVRLKESCLSTSKPSMR